MIVDFHNHFYPSAYLKACEAGDSKVVVERDAEGQLLIVHKGDYNIVVPGHYDPEARLADMDAAGVDLQILTLTTPGVHIEERSRGIELARLVNDEFAELNGRYPSRFTALAALPLQDPIAAAAELERSVTQLGLPGGTIFTNINGRTMDEAHFLPVLEKAVELDVPLFMHPTIPVHIDALDAYRLVALIGFTQETTIAASRMVFSGLFERLPQLKIVLSHLGGHLPFIAERLALGHRVYPECRTELSQSPLDTFKQFYMDTIPYAPQATQVAIQFAGADKLLLGSDYPHQIGDLTGSVNTIQEMTISEANKAKILGENARRLLRLEM